MQAGLSGQRFGYFIYNGKQYDVIGQLTRDLRSRPDDLGNLAVRTMDGRQMVRLDNLISLREASSPPELLRYNRYSSATVSGHARRRTQHRAKASPRSTRSRAKRSTSALPRR